ncbi:hypothetical protein EV182_000739 [Spiromyces aspiralis]|uniref:Uncharacterized protein n=1 Tax=Spiromyces aspiralis TaxID=68401 RepID=A0ACC1HWN1_9FUNG|nr:hypothetical protein EV182_000739 [Spiromyces aspiralis]
MPMPPPELLQQTYGTNYEANHAPETQHLTGDPAGISPHAAPGGDEKRSQRRGILDYVTQFISAPKAQGEGSLFNMPDWLSRLPCIGAKYALVAILFILILVACIVILMYLTLSKDQNCGGGRCNSLGESGLYLSAFGDCHVWYGAPNNTCKNWKSSDTMFAAINYYQFGLYDKLQWSPVCNKCVRIQGPRGTIEAKITDICQNCTYGSIMLSEPAFVLIADDGVDNVPVNWGPC